MHQLWQYFQGQYFLTPLYKICLNTNFSQTTLFSEVVVQKRMQVQFAVLVVLDHQTNQKLLF